MEFEIIEDFETLEKERRKCGEIFIVQSGKFDFNCLLCNEFFEEIKDFFDHINVIHQFELSKSGYEHLNDIKDEDTIKIDTENAIQIDDPELNLEVKLEVQYNDNSEHDESTDLPETEVIYVDEDISSSIVIVEKDTQEIKINDFDLSNKKKIKKAERRTISRRTNGDPNLFCKVCDKRFTQQKSWDSHILTCRAILKHNKNLISGLLKIDAPSKEQLENADPLTCRFCSRRFTDRTCCLEHECKHTGEKLFKCEKCGKAYRLRKLFLKHLRIDNCIKPVVEDVEETKISDTDRNTKSSKLRKKNPNLLCKICGKQFTQQKSWDFHVVTCRAMVEHYENLNSDLLQINLLSKEKLENYDPKACRFCSRRFAYRTSCLEHECTHTGEKLFKCEKCNERFRKRYQLTEHLKTHDGKIKEDYKCHLCDAVFTVSYGLKVHLKRHSGAKPHKCDYCDKCFVSTSEKRLHERIHTGEKPYQCQICGKCFKDGSFFNNHVKAHTDVKTVKCDQCDKYFATRRLMRQHTLIHVTEKNHICKICGAAFNQKRALTNHEKIHSDKKGYICKICGKGFKQKSSLYPHVKSHRESGLPKKISNSKPDPNAHNC